MSDDQRPTILTLIAVLAIIIGIFSGIRGVLMIFGGINQLIAGVGGIFDLIVGLLSAAVGVFAIISGAVVMREKTGGVDFLKKYAIAVIAYNVIWVIYTRVAGGKVSWLSVLVELAICIATIVFIMTNDDLKKYAEAKGE